MARGTCSTPLLGHAYGRKGARIVPYSRLLYHAVWATKSRQPMIDETMEALIRGAVEQTSRELDVTIFAVGIMPEQVHVFAQIPPALTGAKVIGRWKGAPSYAVNAHYPNRLGILALQSGYGVLSVSQRSLAAGDRANGLRGHQHLPSHNAFVPHVCQFAPTETTRYASIERETRRTAAS